jgi:hypothetical protein
MIDFTVCILAIGSQFKSLALHWPPLLNIFTMIPLVHDCDGDRMAAALIRLRQAYVLLAVDYR